METTIAVVVGAVIALMGCFPVVWALELGLKGDARATINRGLIGVLVSFLMSSALLLVAFLVLADAFRACGIAFVVVLVVVWSIETVRAYVLM